MFYKTKLENYYFYVLHTMANFQKCCFSTIYQKNYNGGQICPPPRPLCNSGSPGKLGLWGVELAHRRWVTNKANLSLFLIYYFQFVTLFTLISLYTAVLHIHFIFLLVMQSSPFSKMMSRNIEANNFHIFSQDCVVEFAWMVV